MCAGETHLCCSGSSLEPDKVVVVVVRVFSLYRERSLASPFYNTRRYCNDSRACEVRIFLIVVFVFLWMSWGEFSGGFPVLFGRCRLLVRVKCVCVCVRVVQFCRAGRVGG